MRRQKEWGRQNEVPPIESTAWIATNTAVITQKRCGTQDLYYHETQSHTRAFDLVTLEDLVQPILTRDLCESWGAVAAFSPYRQCLWAKSTCGNRDANNITHAIKPKLYIAEMEKNHESRQHLAIGRAISSDKILNITIQAPYAAFGPNKKAQLSLTNPRDACEKFARST